MPYSLGYQQTQSCIRCDAVQDKLCFPSTKKTVSFIIGMTLCTGIWILYFVALGVEWSSSESINYMNGIYALFPLICCIVVCGVYAHHKKAENKRFVIINGHGFVPPAYIQPNKSSHNYSQTYPQPYFQSNVDTYSSFPSYRYGSTSGSPLASSSINPIPSSPPE